MLICVRIGDAALPFRGLPERCPDSAWCPFCPVLPYAAPLPRSGWRRSAPLGFSLPYAAPPGAPLSYAAPLGAPLLHAAPRRAMLSYAVRAIPRFCMSPSLHFSPSTQICVVLVRRKAAYATFRLIRLYCVCTSQVPRKGLGGAKFRTWSGPGGSSHKGPLTSAHAFSGHFFMSCAWEWRARKICRPPPLRVSRCAIAERPSDLGFIEFIISFLKDPRTQIAAWIVSLGPVLVYCPLFLVVFIETGVVFFPFLPGDSLLFACGVFSAEGWGLNLGITLVVFYAAAILGNTSNYWIARFFGSRILDSGKVKALTPERMAKLDYFFEKYGEIGRAHV